MGLYWLKRNQEPATGTKPCQSVMASVRQDISTIVATVRDALDTVNVLHTTQGAVNQSLQSTNDQLERLHSETRHFARATGEAVSGLDSRTSQLETGVEAVNQLNQQIITAVQNLTTRSNQSESSLAAMADGIVQLANGVGDLTSDTQGALVMATRVR